MDEEKGYDVLKFVTRGDRCYAGTDCIQGKPLIQWLKYHNNIPKEQIYQWMKEMIQNLECFHRLRGNPCYQYVNPCSVIVDKDNKLHLLDLGSDSQKELHRMMLRRGIRENFLSPENQYYQIKNVDEDIYGLGKTLQYLLLSADITPPLSRREEAVFRKFILRCLNHNSKKRFHNIQEVSEHFPGKRKKKIEKRFLLYAVGMVVIFILGSTIFKIEKKRDIDSASAKEYVGQDIGTEEISREMESATEADLPEYREMIYETGLLYFWELKDYQKCRETFEKLEDDELAMDYVSLCGYFLNPDKDRVDRELEMLLSRIEEEMPDTEDVRYFLSLIKGYELLDNEDAVAEKIRLVGICMDMEKWKQRDTEHEVDYYLNSVLASAYEQQEEWDAALEQYVELSEMEKEPEERIKIFYKIAVLYDRMDDVDKAIESCYKGLDEVLSPELANLLIRLQCAESSIDRQICAETVKKYLGAIPELAETEEFKKLQQEYEIKIEGEQVWVGR